MKIKIDLELYSDRGKRDEHKKKEEGGATFKEVTREGLLENYISMTSVSGSVSTSFQPSEASSSLFTGIDMRAIVFLCLLYAAFGQESKFSWLGPVAITPQQAPIQSPDVCIADQSSCGCCLIQSQISRLERFFNLSINILKEELKNSKLVLNNIRASRSAFSVALNNNSALTLYGPFTSDSIIKYKHIFINLGDGYNAETGIFTVPRSGVYSLSVTIYGTTRLILNSCATLQVNNQNVSELIEKNGQDPEDSNTVVVAVQLKAGDRVSVKLLQGCSIIDDINHYNTFTGFLLYASD